MEDLPEDQRIGIIDVVRGELLQVTGLDPSGFLLEAFEARPTWSVLEQVAKMETPSDSGLSGRASVAMRGAIKTLSSERRNISARAAA
jgi:hypothetical protein